jgi:glutamine---fructose-6-phosphate transaminase (isomerizing)
MKAGNGPRQRRNQSARLERLARSSAGRTQGAIGEFEFEAEEPIEVELFGGEPFFGFLAGRGFEFDEHLSLLHVDQDAADGGLRGRGEATGEFFGALPREAGERVLRDVARHSFSRSIKMAADFSAPSNTTEAEKKQMAERRSAHPYYTYEAIQAQPELVERVLARREEIEGVAAALASKERITFAGIGTSLHAARIAENWMQEMTAGRLRVHFAQSFEALHYPMGFGAGDAVAVITHTGTTTASVQLLAAARKAGALTVAITGESAGEGAHAADIQIETCEQEVSFAYTKSYTAALTAIALLIGGVAERRGLLAKRNAIDELEQAPGLMREVLGLEAQTREFAARAARLSRIALFGSGTGWATASEAALKIKESSYIAAEGFETEEILHGPFSELDAGAALVGLLSGGEPDERARQILRAAGELKMLRAAVAPPSSNHEIPAEEVFVVPETPAWLAAFVHLVPLQMLSYFLALARGVNPDTGRQDQTGHAAAAKHYKY